MIKKQTLPQRYLIQNEGPWEGPAEAAIAQSLFICSEHGLSDLHIVVASKDVLDGTAFSVTLGIEISASLLKGKPVVQDSVNITYSTPRIFKQKYFYKNHGVILAAYLPNEYIDQIDSTPKVHSIVFLPWKNDEGKRWAASWQPEIVGEKIWTIPDGVLPSEVHEELSQLTNSVNLETGLAHPSDMESARKIFKRLKNKNVHLDSELLRAFAVRMGWRPSDAEELKVMAEKLLK